MKLFVICASNVPSAVILRRGPTQWYHVIQWSTRSDQFVHGAWIKARIYERACDVSPDGKLFLCKIHQGSRDNTEFTSCWTAICRVPWLQALTVWPAGETWWGGGRFIDDRSIVIRDLGATLPDYPLRGLIRVRAEAPYHQSSNEVPGADWSGRDHDDRIIYTRAGQLFRRGTTGDTIIADFTDLQPDPRPAPAWAGQLLE